MDVVPTILEAVGIDYSNLKIDGKSLLPHLINGKKMPDREIFWEMQNQKAVRKGKWKLVLNGQLVENEPKVSKDNANEPICTGSEKLDYRPAWITDQPIKSNDEQ